MFYIDSYPCLAPKVTAYECAMKNIPIDSWWGKCNSFRCPLGSEPGIGYLLIDQGTLNNLDFEKSHTLQMIDGLGNNPPPIPNIWIADYISTPIPGPDPNDVAMAYVITIADRRWRINQKMGPAQDAQYAAINVRDKLGNYYPGTLVGGTTPYSWDGMLGGIWPNNVTDGLGAYPNLPFTPDGVPENFWYHGVPSIEALQHILVRLACSLKYNQATNKFSIVRLGNYANINAENGTQLLAPFVQNRIWNAWIKSSNTVMWPQFAEIDFVQLKAPANGTIPFFTIDKTITKTAAYGTVNLEDDLTCVFDGVNVTNLTDLQSRALERKNDFVRKRQFFDAPIVDTYTGLLPFQDVPGQRYDQVIWEEIGEGPKTTVLAGSMWSLALENWRRTHVDRDAYFDVVHCRVRSNVVGAHGFAGNIMVGTDAVPIVWTDVTAGGADCWLQGINDHAVFLNKHYEGVFLKFASDGLPIYTIWANEDNCRTEFDGSYTTVQNFKASTAQIFGKDNNDFGTWLDESGPDDAGIVLTPPALNSQFQRTLSTNPDTARQLTAQNDSALLLMLGSFGW